MASRDPAVLSLTQVTRSFGSRQVLCPLSLTIAPGTAPGLPGPTGAAHPPLATGTRAALRVPVGPARPRTLPGPTPRARPPRPRVRPMHPGPQVRL